MRLCGECKRFDKCLFRLFIEGLARQAVSLHVQQAGSRGQTLLGGFVMTTCCSVLAGGSVVEVIRQN